VTAGGGRVSAASGRAWAGRKYARTPSESQRLYGISYSNGSEGNRPGPSCLPPANRDPTDGRLKLIEINPLPWLFHPLSVPGGVDFVTTAYAPTHLGGADEAYREGVLTLGAWDHLHHQPFCDKGIRPPEWKWGVRRAEGTQAQPSPDFRTLSLTEKVMLRGEKVQW